MDNSDNKKNKKDYITILRNSYARQSYINNSVELSSKLNETGKTLHETLKPIIEKNMMIAKMYSKILSEEQSKLNSMLEPLTKMTRQIIAMYEPIRIATISSITKIFKKIDWSQFDLIYKNIALKYLSNGFYPYRNTEVNYEELLNTNSQVKQIKIIKDGIRIDIKKNKKLLLSIYPEYKKYINEINKLYKEHNYRLCILSLINLISIINNEQFEYIDFTEKYKVRKKLLEKQIMKEKETNYLVFSQYIKDKDLIDANQILKNCSETPEEYLKIPYNRNAIAHGYSKKFGNEINCLRWFSVLFNTMEISQKLLNVEYEVSNR